MFRFDVLDSVKLNVTAASPMTEIYVIDGQFGVKARGLGTVQAELPSGLYKIKYKAGGQIVEQHITLGEKPEENVVGPAIAIASPAPIVGTATSREDQAAPARDLSLKTHATVGTGSQFYVFVRETDSEAPWANALKLSLYRRDGTLLIDLDAKGVSDVNQRWAACNIECDPGQYRLRADLGEVGMLEQTVVMSPTYQTQVFLTPRAYGSHEQVRSPDLARGAIYLRRIGRGYRPDAEEEGQAELARLGVADGRPVMSRKDLQLMVEQKRVDPMFGLLAAHLLLLEAKVDLALLGHVLSHLRDLIPDHPDLLVLQAWLDVSQERRPTVPRLMVPPMLRRSWHLLQEPTLAAFGLVEPDSFATFASSRLWTGGVWLVWRSRRWDRLENQSAG